MPCKTEGYASYLEIYWMHIMFVHGLIAYAFMHAVAHTLTHSLTRSFSWICMYMHVDVIGGADSTESGSAILPRFVQDAWFLLDIGSPADEEKGECVRASSTGNVQSWSLIECGSLHTCMYVWSNVIHIKAIVCDACHTPYVVCASHTLYYWRMRASQCTL